MEKTNYYLKLYTTGYLPKKDFIYAYAIAKNQEEPKLKTLALGLEELLTLFKPEIRSKSLIYMYNPLSELKMLPIPKEKIEPIYKNQVIDLYKEIKIFKNELPLEKYSLKEVSKYFGYNQPFYLGPEISEKLGLDIEEKIPEYERELISTVKAIQVVKKGIDKLYDRRTLNINGNIIMIKDMDNKNKSIIGVAEPKKNIFLHTNEFLYEEKKGYFTLQFFYKTIHYDSKRICHFIRSKETFYMPEPMPKGYFMIDLDDEYNIKGILELIYHIRTYL